MIRSKGNSRRNDDRRDSDDDDRGDRGGLSRQDEEELEDIFDQEKPLKCVGMASALRKMGVRPSLVQTRQFQKNKKLLRTDVVTLKQFKAFYAHCKGITISDRSPSPRGSRDRRDQGTLREGDAVEADYGGRGKYFSGKISMVRSDGTYDIRYDDGDSERRVKREI